VIAQLVRQRTLETWRVGWAWLLNLVGAAVVVGIGLSESKPGLQLLFWPVLLGVLPIGDRRADADGLRYLLSRGASRSELLVARAASASLFFAPVFAAMLAVLAVGGWLAADQRSPRTLLLVVLVFLIARLSSVPSFSPRTKGWRGHLPRLPGTVLSFGLVCLALLVQLASTGQRSRGARPPAEEWRRFGLALGARFTELLDRPDGAALWLLAAFAVLLALATLLSWRRAEL